MFSFTVIVIAASVQVIHAQPPSVKGLYRNAAPGYSVVIPDGLEAVPSDQGGPERGFRIRLSSGGSVVVYGEPNSLEFRTASEGVQWHLKGEDCGRLSTRNTRVGQLHGAEGTLICDQRAVKVLSVFRPGGEPIYWFRLETTPEDLARDAAILSRLAGSLRMIRWE